MSARGFRAGPAWEAAADLLVFVATILVYFVEPLRHILDRVPERVADEERFFLCADKGEAVGGAGIDFDELAAEFVFLLENEAGEVGVVLEVVDDGALDGDVEAFADAVDEVMGQRTFLGGVAEEHADDGAHVRFDVYNEYLVVVAYEQGAPAVSGKNSPNLNRHDIVLHTHIVCPKCQKTSPPQAGFGAGKSGVTVEGSIKAPDGSLLANFKQRRIGVMGVAGGDSMGKLVSDTKDIAEDLAKFLSAWAKGNKLK